ncbi:MAG: acetyl-CoA carboxylase biotin carboxyl carrier protein subunit [Bacteriovoracaceae bacterium]|nr:acetyl-CoA carboxylase biotin carboxyl carrier protein subunit [Bacteriovoracaceae bacterium]
MRYYFVDQDRKDTVIDLNQVDKAGVITRFTFQDKTFYARKLAGKLFGSWDEKKWFKLTQLSPGETVVSNTVTYKMYRGFKPSGLFNASAGALVTQMPGKVVKLMAKVGDKVEKGQTILILEAMKMENEIKAGMSGILKTLYVEPGQALESGVLMAEIEE